MVRSKSGKKKRKSKGNGGAFGKKLTRSVKKEEPVNEPVTLDGLVGFFADEELLPDLDQSNTLTDEYICGQEREVIGFMQSNIPSELRLEALPDKVYSPVFGTNFLYPVIDSLFPDYDSLSDFFREKVVGCSTLVYKKNFNTLLKKIKPDDEERKNTLIAELAQIIDAPCNFYDFLYKSSVGFVDNPVFELGDSDKLTREMVLVNSTFQEMQYRFINGLRERNKDFEIAARNIGHLVATTRKPIGPFELIYDTELFGDGKSKDDYFNLVMRWNFALLTHHIGYRKSHSVEIRKYILAGLMDKNARNVLDSEEGLATYFSDAGLSLHETDLGYLEAQSRLAGYVTRILNASRWKLCDELEAQDNVITQLRARLKSAGVNHVALQDQYDEEQERAEKLASQVAVLETTVENMRASYDSDVEGVVASRHSDLLNQLSGYERTVGQLQKSVRHESKQREKAELQRNEAWAKLEETVNQTQVKIDDVGSDTSLRLIEVHYHPRMYQDLYNNEQVAALKTINLARDELEQRRFDRIKPLDEAKNGRGAKNTRAFIHRATIEYDESNRTRFADEANYRKFRAHDITLLLALYENKALCCWVGNHSEYDKHITGVRSR